MKICLVAPYFAPARGGVETFTLQTCVRLRETYGHEVVVVTTRPGGGSVSLEERMGFKAYVLPARLQISNTPVGLRWYRQLREIFAREQPDVINAHTPVPFLADLAERARGNIPLVLTVHNDIEKSSLLGKLISAGYYRLLGNKTLAQCEGIIATSDYYVMTSRRLSSQRAKITIATCGVDMDLFYPLTSISKGQQGRRLVLFVGSMDATHAHKGLDILLRSMAQLQVSMQNVLLMAVGKGDAIPRYQQLASHLGIAHNVVFPGSVADLELANLYRLADVCVLPSTNRSEGLGLVLIEASACQTPTIGTRVGGIPCAVQDKVTGLLVEPGNVEALTAAISRILSDNEFAATLGANGAVYVRENFTWSTSAEATNAALIGVAHHSPEHLLLHSRDSTC